MVSKKLNKIRIVMKNRYLLLFILLLTGGAFPQNADTTTVGSQLRTIYESLEYNTIAFDDLKKKWILTDPFFVREIYNRFVVRDELRINDQRVSLDILKQRSQEIFDGKILIDLRKRYYDDEVEYFAFVPESEIDKLDPKYLFDPIRDPFLLRDILGEKIYSKIKDQSYFFSNLTKTEYDSKNGYYFDLYMNLLEPRVMYWNTTSGLRNKYTLAMFGKWGADQVLLPGWHSMEFIVGNELTYYSTIASNPDKYTYRINLGIAMPSTFPFKSELPASPLLVTGQAVYFKIAGDPLKLFDEDIGDFLLTWEGKYTATDFSPKDIGNITPLSFSSNRSYFILEGRLREITNLGDFGMLEAAVGLSSMEISKYTSTPGNGKLTSNDGGKGFFDKLDNALYVDAGVSRTGGLLQHRIHIMMGYSSDGYGFFGLKSKVMLSDNFGFDFRIINALGYDKNKFPTWRKDSYMVFSPILRINY